MARTRSDAYDLQRDRIADLAVRSFATSGYASATMGAIAQACGISKANLYHYFSGKDALLFHALERYTEGLATLGAPADEGDAPPGTVENAEPGGGNAAARRRLARLIEAFVVAYSDAAHYHKALLHDVHHLPAPSRERIRALERQIVGKFQDAILGAYPALRHHPHPGALTMSLLGMLNFSFAWWRPGGSLDAKAFAQELVLLWTGALHARAEYRPDTSPAVGNSGRGGSADSFVPACLAAGSPAHRVDEATAPARLPL